MPRKRKIESTIDESVISSVQDTPKWFDTDDVPTRSDEGKHKDDTIDIAEISEIDNVLERSDKNTKKQENFDWAHCDEKEEDVFERSVMHQSKSLIDNTKSTSMLNIKRVSDVNLTSPSKSAVTSVKFHGSGNLIATGGLDQFLKIYY